MASTSTSSASPDTSAADKVAQLQAQFDRRLQHYLDKCSPHLVPRWAGWATVVFLYFLRVFFLQGFYIITYGLGIYNLNLLLGFITPQQELDSDGPDLPTKSDQEFRPFVRRLPEFKFWYASLKSFLLGFLMTFFPVFDVPVFWPILLLYWFVLFGITMKRQIKHMIKHKYVPWSTGKKQSYAAAGGKGKAPAAAGGRSD